MTKVKLMNLHCNETEDNSGADECHLKIWADSSFQSHRRSMEEGEDWPLDIVIEFERRVKIQLIDRDNPGFPWYDGHDYLGTCIIRPNQVEPEYTFDRDGADYVLSVERL